MVTKETLEAIVTDNVVKLPAVPSPPQLLQEALAKGASIDIIDKLLTAQERWEKMQATKAFNTAVAAFKADPDRPTILKNVTVSFDSRGGNTSYKHEDLADLLAAVDPALAKHGLWVRFKIHSGERITVKCILGHADGYSEEASELSSAPDNSGGKNPIQAIGSAVSYLQRYTLKAALGLAAAKDDDGAGSGGARNGSVVSDEQATAIREKLKGFPGKSVNTFLTKAGALSVSDILAVKYDSCIRYLDKQIEAKERKR